VEGSPVDALRKRRFEGVSAGTLDDGDERRRIPEDLSFGQVQTTICLVLVVATHSGNVLEGAAGICTTIDGRPRRGAELA
jgi:hypothetical protein